MCVIVWSKSCFCTYACWQLHRGDGRPEAWGIPTTSRNILSGWCSTSCQGGKGRGTNRSRGSVGRRLAEGINIWMHQVSNKSGTFELLPGPLCALCKLQALWYCTLKGVVHPKIKSHSLSTHHYAEWGGWVKCLGPQNTSGVSGVNSIEAKSNTIEVSEDHVFKCEKTTDKKHKRPPTAPVVSSKCP